MVKGRVFKIRSPRGHGTGFHVGTYGSGLCAIATANHVIQSELDWNEPIKLVHFETGKEILLSSENRAIIPFRNSDMAMIVFPKPADLVVPEDEISFLQSEFFLNPGVSIGWCGFPAVRNEQLCFFHGYISCHLPSEERYLVDGVAINGVSGGPVFFIENNRPIIAGVISAYIPNRSVGDSLPGVSVVSWIRPEYENMVKSLRNLPSATEVAEKIQDEQN